MRSQIIVFILAISLMGIKSYSQNKNEIKLQYGAAKSYLTYNTLFTKMEVMDGPEYKTSGLNNFAVRYSRQISGNFSIGSGFDYSRADLTVTPSGFSGERPVPRYEQIMYISIPVNAGYTFFKYFFIDGGLHIGIQVNENSIDKQSGLGYNIGAGVKYTIKRISIIINPYLKRNNIIAFAREDIQLKLTEYGIQFGVGYSF